jgi:hypothetical protein
MTMPDPCPRVADLLELVGRPAQDLEQDWRWNHAQTCPRCRSLLAAYASFAARESGEKVPGESGAVPRLNLFLQRRILGARPDPTRAGATSQARGRFRLFSRWPRLLVPAFGAAAILIGAFLLVRDDLPAVLHTSALREGPGRSATENVTALPPRVLDGGGIALRWRRIPSAEAYRVRLLDAGLEKVLDLSAGPDTLLVLEQSLLAKQASAVFWQVEALSQGDRIGDSAPARLPREGNRRSGPPLD